MKKSRFELGQLVRHKLTGEVFVVVEIKLMEDIGIVNLLVRNRGYEKIGFVEHELEPYERGKHGTEKA